MRVVLMSDTTLDLDKHRGRQSEERERVESAEVAHQRSETQAGSAGFFF